MAKQMGFEVLADGVNLRAGPGTNYTIIEQVKKGDIVVSTGWVPIESAQPDKPLYISSQFVQIVDIVQEAPSPTPTPTPTGYITGQDIIKKALTQKGKPYIYGYEVDLADPDPVAFDCSELSQWVCHQLGIKPEVPDGALYQYRHCRTHKTLISVNEAKEIPGALLFKISEDGNHIAISQGKKGEVFEHGKSIGIHWLTIEARGKDWGVGCWAADRSGFTHAGLIPGVKYS